MRKRSRPASGDEPRTGPGTSSSSLSSCVAGTEPAKRMCVGDASQSSTTAKMRSYKKRMKYNRDWQMKWRWLLYDEDGMYCSICMNYGKPPPQTRGAWVTRPVQNWVKAVELLSKHGKSEWHLAAIEALAMSESAKQHGDIVDKMLAASEMERQQNRELMKKLIRSLYFLVRHRIPHTTTFEGLIELQIDNGNDQLHENTQAKKPI